MITNNNIYKRKMTKISMTTIAVELKIMPEAVNTDLEAIKKKITEKLKEAKNIKIEENEIAFGLKALKVYIAWPENLDTDQIENKVAEIKGVSSVTIEDIRRAFG